MRVAGYHAEHDGYMNDGLDDQDDSAGRLSFLLAPNDELSIRVVADYFDQGGLGTGSTPIALDPDNRYGISAAEGGAYYETQWQRDRSAQLQCDAAHAAHWTTSSGASTRRWTGRLPSGTFTLLPAYRESHLDTEGAAIGTNVITREDDRQESLEARFASNLDGRFSYIVGAYYFDEKNHVPQFVPNTQYTMSVQDYDTGVESAAAFGELTFPFTESLRATVGARYTHEEKFLRGTLQQLTAPSCPSACPGLERIPVTQVTPLTSETDASDGAITDVRFDRVRRDRDLREVDVAQPPSTGTSRTTISSLPASRPASSPADSSSRTTPRYSSPKSSRPSRWARGTGCLDDRLQLDVEAFHWRYEDQQVSTYCADRRT